MAEFDVWSEGCFMKTVGFLGSPKTSSFLVILVPKYDFGTKNFSRSVMPHLISEKKKLTVHCEVRTLWM